MTMTRTILLGSAALIAGISGAAAADLPTKKAAPVEYVRVCSVHGEGFWYIPGTDTCIKISGRVRAEFGYATPQNSFGAAWKTDGKWVGTAIDEGADGKFYGTTAFSYGRNEDATGFQANGRLNVDVRTSTEWGTLRAFFRYDAYRNTGVYQAGGGANAAESVGLDNAYIQWAGITAGKLGSAFDFYANDLNWTSIAGSDHGTIQFRYTATFGSGFSAVLSIEDQTATNAGLYAAGPSYYGYYDGSKGAILPSWYGNTISYGGTRVPDVVAALRVDQGWGSAQLSAALHQSRFSAWGADYANTYGFSTEFNPDSAIANEAYASSEWGYAIQAGVKINLPMLAAGDVLWLQAAYANGASTYLGANNIPLSLGSSAGVAADQFVFPVYALNKAGEPYFTGQTSNKAQSGWALTAAALHYWTPTVRQALFGSYLQLNNPNGSLYWQDGQVSYGCTTEFCTSGYGPEDTTVWQVGTNVIWSPVSGLDIGAEVGYVNVDNGKQPYAVYGTYDAKDLLPTAIAYKTTGSENQFYARFRIQREF